MTSPLRVGAGFLGHLSSQVTVQEVVDAAVRCERAGLDSFWVADQRWMRDAWVSLAAVAENTDRILIGTRITDPYIRHPALTAVAAATLDERSGGRFTLGLGAGGSGFPEIGLERRRPVVALREAIVVIRRLWVGDPTTFEGEMIQWGWGTIGFESRHDIPIVIASRGPKLLSLSGEIADGAIIATGTTPSAIEWARARINTGAAKAGRRPGDVESMHQTYVSVDDDDPRKAVQAARQGILGAVVGSFPAFDFLAAAGLEPPAELVHYLESGERDRETILRMIPDGFVTVLAAAGSARTVAERIIGMADAGIEHVLVASIPSGEEGELAQLERFIERVLPELR